MLRPFIEKADVMTTNFVGHILNLIMHGRVEIDATLNERTGSWTHFVSEVCVFCVLSINAQTIWSVLHSLRRHDMVKHQGLNFNHINLHRKL